jgi:hypothetical protein
MHRTLLALLLATCFLVPFSDLPTATRAQNQLSQEPLTNSDVFLMVRSKLSVVDIIAKIKTSRCHFDTTPTVLEELRYKRVPEAVLAAMSEAPFGAPMPPRVEVPKAEIIRKDVGRVRSDSSPVADKAERAEPPPGPLR